ncbi:MAG: restriction endonuclease subunit S [Deltaproteobacteria bacterium]|nr:restriction endonuclease subunit S [Deltaproteobacteria bacterium]
MKWPVLPLSTALASAEVFTDGDWVESKDQDPHGDVRLVQLADVGDGGYIDKSARFLTSTKARELRCTFLKPGDVMVARMPDPLGRACIFPGDPKPSVTVVDVCVIRPDSRAHDPRWLMHCLNASTCRNQIAGFATGTTRSRISRGNLGKITIPIPPLSEQRRIAEVLDRADALRAKRRAALAQLDTLTQAIFLDMFGDRPPGSNGLKQVCLSDVTTRITDGTHLTPQFVEAGVPFIFVKNVRNGVIDFRTDKFISEEQFKVLYGRCPIEEGDVLYTTVGTYGEAASVGTFTKFAFQRHVAHLKPDVGKVVPSFLGTLMQLPIVKYQADRWARGVAQPTINLKELREFVVPMPRIGQQRDFTRRVAAVEKLKATQRASLAELNTLFASLQHRAFRGEL